MEKEYLNEREVASMTGLALPTLRNWRYQRKGFSYVRLGGKRPAIRYLLQDVRAFMEGHRIELGGPRG
ncbi:MAG TPA: helix-turn-helix domain-containing protein [Syntrophales bacterium]|nr:helix-turn-helix domain-containing protein [Syntrophales bacterium]